MAIESELKLRIAPGHLAKLKRHALFKTHQLARPVSRRLYNVYFDTPELDLNKSMMALRLRRKGRQWLQTLKGGGGIKGGLHQRNEWEFPVRGAALDFSHPMAADWDVLLPQAWREKLQPVFVTDFVRSSRIVVYNGAHIEVCMDEGDITAGERKQEICELELELKSGEPRQLFELALAILDIVPFEIEVVNKAEYGFRLLGDFVEQPHKCGWGSPASGADLSQGMQTLIWSCLLHIQKNWRGALAGEDVDFLHQVRVGFRRLRVLLQHLQQLRNDETLEVLNADLADLSVLLGRARDWDVFITQTLAAMLDKEGLLAASVARRAMCHAALQQQAVAMQSLMLRFALWMNGEYWTKLAMYAPKAQDFAARRLNKLAHRFALNVAQLRDNDAEQLHDLRIVAKKLRYSAEAFAAWFDERHTDDFLTALANVQQVLGLMNDATVAQRLLIGLTEADAAQLPAAQRVQERLAHDLRLHHDALRHALKHFDKQAIFWRV